MFFFRPLPWEYAVRNLFRRPLRSLLTLLGLSTVIILVVVVVGFIRGLERSLEVTGDPLVALIFSLGMGENLEYSSIPMRSSDLVPGNIKGVVERQGRKSVSPELYLGTQVGVGEEGELSMGLVRGVTRNILSVRRTVQLEEGRWPGPGEVIVGRLVATKLGATGEQLTVGKTLRFEGRKWRVSGVFSAVGGAFESEVWCRLDELQTAMSRQDLSLVAIALKSSDDFAELDLFCRGRLDLELQAMRERDYYSALTRDYAPVRMLAWLVVCLVSGAGVFAGLNTMYASVLGRVRELAALQTIGFLRRAVVISLLEEGLLLAAAASLLGVGLAVLGLGGMSVRFTMGAFSLSLDAVTVLIGCGVGLGTGLLGTLPAAIRALRMPIVEGLKTI